MVNTVLSGAILGIKCQIVYVQVDVSNGLPCFEMIGMLGIEVREAKERVRVALKNYGISLPPLRITVNLSPANIKKDGTAYDLAIAIGVLQGIGELESVNLDSVFIAGELGLNGEITGVCGVLPMTMEVKERGIKTMIVPYENGAEALNVDGIDIIGVRNLNEVVGFLKSSENERKTLINIFIKEVKEGKNKDNEYLNMDFDELCGQESLKRAMLISAAGFHNVLMIGPPGAGKTMAAKRLTTIMPPLTKKEYLEVSNIYSVCGLLDHNHPIIETRPFMHPHHTISETAMAGGGRIPRPGIISRAHKGVLFLDEAVHFSGNTLETLRQPLEDKNIQICRTYGNFTFPAEFMLVVAINPCPCGYYPDLNKCNCTPEMIRRYLGKLSGPILDRIDICVELPSPSFDDLEKNGSGMCSQAMRDKVLNAIAIQNERYSDINISFNSQLTPSNIYEYINLGKKEHDLVENIFKKMQLSARGYHRILKLSRTIADLDDSKQILCKHIMEAVCYKGVEEKYWGI